MGNNITIDQASIDALEALGHRINEMLPAVKATAHTNVANEVKTAAHLTNNIEVLITYGIDAEKLRSPRTNAAVRRALKHLNPHISNETVPDYAHATQIYEYYLKEAQSPIIDRALDAIARHVEGVKAHKPSIIDRVVIQQANKAMHTGHRPRGSGRGE